MTQHDPLVRVHHMLDHAQEAMEMAHGRSRIDLDTDRMLNLSLVRLMEIIGEAASRISEGFRLRHPQIPWQDVADLRNRSAHGYSAIDFDILWAIIQDDLPPLIMELEKIVENT